MKIAQVAPLIERVPPKAYGGTERVVHALTEELIARGHDVTLYATGDSITSAKLESVYPRGLREAKLTDYAIRNWTLLNIGLAFEMQDDFDIIHDHSSPLSMPTANLAITPVVITMHGPFNAENRKIYQSLPNPYIATISKSQLYTVPNINHIGTVYNGLNMAHYPFGEVPDDYVLYVGRITMKKGVHFAIDVAQYLDLRLIIAAKLDEVDRQYFEAYIHPRLSERIRWIGEVDEAARNKLMSKAKCLLHPITWREPFGLTLIEAMACGTPVVAFNRGSIPEIVQTGVTGYVVEDIEAMIDAVSNVGKISRRACREHALANFNAKRMADGYEEVYKKVLEKQNPA